MKLSKKLLACLLAVLMVFSAAGCAGSSQAQTTAAPETTAAETTVPETTEATQEAETRVVVDSTGASIEVPAHPKHIVVSPTVLTNMIFFMMGTADTQLAITPAALTGYENSIMKDLAPDFGDKVNTTMINKDLTVNLEELAGSEADLVLYWDSQADEAAQVNKMGIPAFCVHSAKDMATLKELVAMLGDVLNCPEQADEILAWYDEAEARMHAKDDEVSKLTDDQKPKVLQMNTMDNLKIFYKGVNRTFIEQVGGRAIDLTGASAESSTPTMEEIYAFNPDILLLSNWDDYTPEDLYGNRIEGQDWSGVNAVINHRVYKVPLGLYRWTPPNCTEKPLYWYYLASLIQPEIFSDIDLRQEVSDFFVRFFDYQLTDAQIDSILHTELNALSE